MVPKNEDGSDITAEQLQSWKLLGDFRSLLAEIPASAAQKSTLNKGGPKRLLTEDDYLTSFLFAQFNPIIDSMRGLCACSHFQKVQDEVCTRPMSLGSFSEAQSVFGFERLEALFTKLASENIRQTRPNSNVPPGLLKSLRLVDSSVFYALPRMSWAHWRKQGNREKPESALRLHLSFSLLDEKPSNVHISPAKLCERKGLKEIIKPDEFYVGDRYYGRDYHFLQELSEAGCSFLMRLYEGAKFTVLENLPITQNDREAGVVSDQIVNLGARERPDLEPVRVIRIEKPELDEPVILVTNQLSPEEMPAALLAGIYHQRWEIELFFKWLKCIFGRRKQWHWFAESANGVNIQLYCALIASLLLSRRLGKLPDKRTMEALKFHQMGMATSEELARILPKVAVKKPK